MGITLSGSYAKGTAVSLSSHVDILISLKLDPGEQIHGAFWNLSEYLAEQNLRPHTRYVSIQVQSQGLRVDLIPAWPTNEHGHVLYHREPTNSVQTNVGEHIHMVSHSGRTQEICALKVWRERHGLDFPSFLLELATLQALEGHRFGQLADNVFSVFRFLESHFEKVAIRDPANSDNVVSDELSAGEKRTIARAARKALDEENWEKILW